ncbi:MAG TPA: PspC domain-containing protein [Allosphingosinicella sp.]|jgi:phage shock protein PspC (stress-responsive transcriptional regulator)
MHFLDRPSLFNRPDTFLGVSQGLGEDLGIHPNLVRLAFAALLFWNPAAAACTYAGLGLLVLATRLVFPAPAAAEQAEAAPLEEPANPEASEQLPLAA